MEKTDIVIIGEDKKTGDIICSCVKKEGLTCTSMKYEKKWFETIDEKGPFMIVMKYEGKDLASVKDAISIKDRAPHTQVIMVAAKDVESSHIVAAMNEGVMGFLLKPLGVEEMSVQFKRAQKRYKEAVAKEKEVDAMKRKVADLTDKIERYAKQDRKTAALNKRKRTFINEVGIKLFSGKEKILVLIIGDSLYQSAMLKQKIDSSVFQIVTAEDALSGIEKAKQINPKIVLSDLELPDMNGVDLCKKLKGEEGFSDLYFIICTAAEDKYDAIIGDDLIMSNEMKVDDCVAKPAGEEEMAELLSRIYLGIM